MLPPPTCAPLRLMTVRVCLRWSRQTPTEGLGVGEEGNDCWRVDSRLLLVAGALQRLAGMPSW